MARGPSTTRGPQPELADAARPGLHRTHIAILAQSRSAAVRKAVARRGDLPFGVQAALANDDAHQVRAAIAANPRAAGSLMSLLAGDPHHRVLLALAGNPGIYHDVAVSLAGHRRADVREAATRRLMARDTVSAVPDPDPDPDAKFPELRERARAHFETAPASALAAPVPIAFHHGTSLSRLAQHVAAVQRLATQRADRHIGSPGLQVSAAS